MASNGNETEKLLREVSAKNGYGSTTNCTNQCCKQEQDSGPSTLASITDFVFDGFFLTENTRTSVAGSCSCGSCNQDECRAINRLKAGGESSARSRAFAERSGSSDSLGSYNNPSTPTRSRASSSDSKSSSILQMDPMIAQTIVRSTILCKGICCSSEVPELMELLTPINGIAEVKVNVPLKQIILDHDCRVISATQIVNILEEELFPSTVERDGGASIPSIVRSTFATKGICCSSEVPAILEILNPFDGIIEVNVVVPRKIVIVDHNCKIISAAQIAKILCDEEFESKVETDGGASKNVVGVEGRSKFYIGGLCCSCDIPAIRTILEPKNGVKGLLVTVATKMVCSTLCSMVTISKYSKVSKILAVVVLFWKFGLIKISLKNFYFFHIILGLLGSHGK